MPGASPVAGMEPGFLIGMPKKGLKLNSMAGVAVGVVTGKVTLLVVFSE